MSHRSRARGSADRATGSGPVGRGFESLRARKVKAIQEEGYRVSLS